MDTSSLTIIRNAIVVTLGAERITYLDGAVAIRGSNIEAVGRTADILERYADEPRTEVDASGHIAMPGLIEGHCHPALHLLSGPRGGPQLGGSAPKSEGPRVGSHLVHLFRSYTHERSLPASLIKAGAKLCFADMVRCGVTCFNEAGSTYPDEIGAAAVESGLRGTICRSTRDLIPSRWADPSIFCEDTATNISESERLLEQWQGAGEGRIRAWLGLRNPYTSSDNLVREIGALGQRHGVGIHGHLASNFGDRAFSISEFGKGVIDRYKDLGVLGPNFYAAHMCELDEAEAQTIIDRNVKIAHCPVFYVKYGLGLGTKIPELHDAGVPIALGTDGAPISGSQDIFRVIFGFATSYCEERRKSDVISPLAALEAATIESAKANLRDSEIGSLEPGKRADLILVDASGPEWSYPGVDVARSITYVCNADKVRSVWVDGKQLMKDRVLIGVDIDEIRSEITSVISEFLPSVDPSVHRVWPTVN